MLSDYLEMYYESLVNGSTVTQRQILKELAELGMDKITVDVLIEELYGCCE